MVVMMAMMVIAREALKQLKPQRPWLIASPLRQWAAMEALAPQWPRLIASPLGCDLTVKALAHCDATLTLC